MHRFDLHHQALQRLRDELPRLIDILNLDDAMFADLQHHLDSQLLSLLDPKLPLMVTICGGANSGKSTLFNSLLGARLSPSRGDAGSTRRILVAGNPSIVEQTRVIDGLFAPLSHPPVMANAPEDLLTPGPPLLTTHSAVPVDQVLIDTPDFDTGLDDRYLNRDVAAEVLEASHVLIYIVTNATYNNLENTRFIRRMLTEAGMRPCILVYNCSRTFTDEQAAAHLHTTADHLYGDQKDDYVLGWYRTDVSDTVATGKALMALRTVQPGDSDLNQLLHRLDPRQLREQQIQATVEAFLAQGNRVAALAHMATDELRLYTGLIRLALSEAVQQALVTIPVERIMRRMNEIWLETSPKILKVLRGVGAVVGKPARLVFGLFTDDKSRRMRKETEANRTQALESLRLNLMEAAADLRDKLLSKEMSAETTEKDPEGKALIQIVDRIHQKSQRLRIDSQVQMTVSHRGTVVLRAVTPPAALDAQKDFGSQPWPPVADRIGAEAETLLNLSSDAALDRDLNRLVSQFRKQMDFTQRSRESLFASLNILPATLSIAYILTTGDPIGGSGIHAKLHGLFGMHDLWALVSIPATAGLDETGRKNLTAMLTPVVSSWLESRAVLTRTSFEKNLTDGMVQGVEQVIEAADTLIGNIEHHFRQLEA